MDEHSCVAKNSREPDRVLYDHQLEGELPTQVQAPLDIKNLGNPPPTRKYINTEETAGHGVQALGGMLPQIADDIADDPSPQDVSYEENTSLPHGLSSLDDKITYPPTVGVAGGDSSTQKSSAIGMEWEKENEEGKDEVHSRAPDELTQVTMRSNTSEIDLIKKMIVSQSVRVNSDRLKQYEMSESMKQMKKDMNIFQTEIVSLKTENYERKKENDERKKENDEMKREMSAMKRENFKLKRENSKLKSENHKIKIENMFSEIERENFSIESEKSALEKIKSALEKIKCEIERENTVLEIENAALKRELSKLE